MSNEKPNSLTWLLDSPDAAKGRSKRAPKFVAHMEMHPFHEPAKTRFVELDGDSGEHARRLAQSWCDHHGAFSGAIRRVFPDGTLSEKIGDYVTP